MEQRERYQAQVIEAAPRITVEIEYLDGKKETYEAQGKINITPGLPWINIQTSPTDEVAIMIASVRKWTARRSKLSVAGN